MVNQSRNIIVKQITDLLPYINNARTHSDEQVSQIVASIKEFGFTNPILITGDGSIIAGHGRVMAAKKLKLTEIPCIELDHLSDTQRKAYILADNKLALNAGWDYNLLKIEIEHLKENQFDIEIIGFDSSEINFNPINYDILNEADVDEQLDAMASGVKKAIQIEFDIDHYEEAQQVIKYWRGQGADVGYMILQHLKAEKSNL
jgi:ParB family transcriptional regulator, chromosome partitioning protein